MAKILHTTVGLLLLLAVLLTACGGETTPHTTETAAATTSSQASTAAKSTPQTETQSSQTSPSTTTSPKTEKPPSEITRFSPDLDNANVLTEDVLLSVFWGKYSGELGFVLTPDDATVRGPECYTMGEDETIYIFDTTNERTFKSFKDGKVSTFFSSIGRTDFGDNEFIREMVAVSGSVIAYSYSPEKHGIYKITGSEVKELNIFCEGATDDNALTSFQDGTFMLQDKTKSGKRWRVFDVEGNMLEEYYNDSHPFGYVTIDNVIYNKDEYVVGISQIDENDNLIYIVELAIGLNPPGSKGLTCDAYIREIGQDNKGYVYFEIQRICPIPGEKEHYDAPQWRNIIRINLKDEKMDVGKIDLSNSKPERKIGEDGRSYIYKFTMNKRYTITPNGTVYYAATPDDKVNFYRYRFD